jgi:chaperone modulatory protein CbpM
MGRAPHQILSGELLDEAVVLTLAQFCRTCRLPAEQVVELVEEGIIEPLGQAPDAWQFTGVSVYRVQCVLRLEHDLGVNRAGAALILDLLDQLDALRARLARYGE